MVFSSPVFLFVFLPAFLLINRLLPARARSYWTLAASLVFYAWGEPKWVLLMVAAIAVTWAAGVAVSAFLRQGKSRAAGIACTVGILCILGSLIWFKYANLLAETVKSLTHARFKWKDIALPIGISFYTFQAMSYLWDVRRGGMEAIRNPLKLGAYIAMFPQLIAGPIVRAGDVAGQLDAPQMTLENAWRGMLRFALGLSKKVLLANSLAVVTQTVFQLPADRQAASTLWLGVIVYAFQIYYDFSGYSDMAIGLGRMMGFTFPENFDLPYTAVSVRDFWRRWHKTLSSWLRDYVYIPLGGNRKGSVRTMLNLMIVFLICGFWHGASWNYVLWGVWYGLWMMLERIPAVQRAQARLPKVIGWALTMLIVLIGWLFFQEGTLASRFRMLGIMFGAASRPSFTGIALMTPKLILVLIASVLFASPLVRLVKTWAARHETGLMTALKSAAACVLLAACVALLMADTYNPFIYFRF